MGYAGTTVARVATVGKSLPRGESLWIATTPETGYAPLAGDIDADVAVVGGGIVGIVAAVLLRRAGRSVVLLERDRIGLGVTGNTTAKLTSQHGLVYADLAKRAGDRIARLYGQANEGAIAWVADQDVDADLRRAPAYVWASNDQELAQVRAEAAAASRLGLPATFEPELPLAVDSLGAVRFDGQALIHPRKLLLGLSRELDEIYERTPVTGLDESDRVRLRTPSGTVTANAAVLATHIPFADRGLYFTRAFAHRGYALAAAIEADSSPDGMFINAGSPTRSVRPAGGQDGEPLLVVAGEGHLTGSGDASPERWAALEDWARERFPLGEIHHRWSTQDTFAPDGRPLVGPLRPGSRSVFVATGFGGWGMTGGIAAAHVLTALAMGRPSPWTDAFDSLRLGPLARSTFWRSNSAAPRHLIVDRFRAAPAERVDSLQPGEGVVVRRGREFLAVSRDDAGTLHAVSAACTHLGCVLAWNGAEESWDCPCHGSRFSCDGEVLHGPAVKPLERKEL
jgi:glycine/D-amino acid oxidase-like deaminating enzyme/nitrite reductase/ring-hydroxylating ferredoxin subunit